MPGKQFIRFTQHGQIGEEQFGGGGGLGFAQQRAPFEIGRAFRQMRRQSVQHGTLAEVLGKILQAFSSARDR